MRLVRYSFLLALSAMATGCGKDAAEIGSFDVDQSIPEIHVKGSSVSALLPTEFSPIPLNVKTEEGYKNENFDYLTTVAFDSLTLSIAEKSNDVLVDTSEDGVADNFDFFGSVSIYIRANINGVERKELIGELTEASEQLNTAQTTISFDMSGVDILQFIEASDGYEIITESKGVPPNDDVYFEGEAVYRFGVGFR